MRRAAVAFSRTLLAAALVVTVSAEVDTSQTALFDAIERGSVTEVERLLKRGANANVVGDNGVPALMEATLFGDVKLMEVVLAHGADANRTGPGGMTALTWAVPDVAKVRLLLAHGANVNAKSDNGRTALLVASSFPRTVDLLKLLLERGADLRAQDGANATALSLAVRSSDLDVVKFLVGNGLDPKALSPSAVRVALARWDRPTTDFLVSQGVNPPPDLLLTTVNWEPTELVAHWIDAGANVNATNNAQYSRTPLLSAAASDAPSSVANLRLLLERGADPNARMTEGESALDFAIYKGDRAKIQLLEQHGAMRGDGPRRSEVPAPSRSGRVDARVALTKSVSRLLDAAPRFRQQTNCVSCHHNALPSLTAAVLARKGIEIDHDRADKALADLETFFKTSVQRQMLGDPAVGGEALTAGYALVALAASGHSADATTAATVHWILARQMPDGRWLGNGLNRPPSEYSLISHTAMAVGGVKAYPPPNMRKEIGESLRRARHWLIAAEPASAEERAMRLMGLVWTDAPHSVVNAAVKAVRQHQDASGGWSQFDRTTPDAYATGMSLYALHLAGVSTTDDAYRKGVTFLLDTQYEDGAWFVRSHTFPVQRYFESGFPFRRHQWISSAGTSWASLAIAQTLPDAAAAQSIVRGP
jgi:N-acyl-D-amino-acid deacylase